MKEESKGRRYLRVKLAKIYDGGSFREVSRRRRRNNGFTVKAKLKLQIPNKD